MGTWSADPFGNDDAVDWGYSLVNSTGVGCVSSALDLVVAKGDDYLEAPEAACAIAAAAVLDAMVSKAGNPQFPLEVNEWVSVQNAPISASLVAKATGVLERILAEDSELQDLWRESDEYQIWRGAVADVATRLRHHQP